jgi:hypothetical protein
MMANHRHFSFALALSAVFVASIATADPTASSADSGSGSAVQGGRAQDLEKARAHFQQGVQFYNAADYKLSLIEFRRSYELSNNYRILYNIGQVNQQLGNYTKALAALEQYLREGGAELEDERKAEVSANALVLRTRVAHVRLLSNVTSPEILIDGFPVENPGSNPAITLDPGDHRVDLRKPGYQPGGTVLSLAAGDVIEARVNLVKIPASTSHAGPAANAPRGRDPTWLWIGWGTTAAAALGAGITGILASTQASELMDLRNSSWSTQAQRDKVGGRAKTFAIASDVLTGTALLAGAASLYLTLSPGSSEPEQPRKPATRVALSGTGVRIEQSF